MFVERSTQYTSFSPRKQPANAGTECKQFTENASVALQQPILTHAYTKCPPVGDTLQRPWIAPFVCNRCCRDKSHKFSLTWLFATCCSDKILFRRQRFSQKFCSAHEAICRCDVSPHLVAATSRPTCTHGVICRHDVSAATCRLVYMCTDLQPPSGQTFA